MFLPHPRVNLCIVGSLRDREVVCSASDRQGPNFESCVWRIVSSHSSHHPYEILLAQFSLYVHKGGLKPDSFILHRKKSSIVCYLFNTNTSPDQINKPHRKLRVCQTRRISIPHKNEYVHQYKFICGSPPLILRHTKMKGIFFPNNDVCVYHS